MQHDERGRAVRGRRLRVALGAATLLNLVGATGALITMEALGSSSASGGGGRGSSERGDGRPSIDATIEADALRLLDQLAAGEFDAAQERFSSTARKQLTPERLRQTWTGIVAADGAYEGHGAAVPRILEGFRVVEIPLRFQRNQKILRVTVDGEGAISGLYIFRVGAQ